MEAPSPLIDIGVNLTNKRFSDKLEPVLTRARDAGVESCIITGTDEASSEAAIELCQAFAEQFPAALYSTCGIHPHDASHFNANSYGNLRELAQCEFVKAIGETGLDFNRDFSPRPLQEKAFESQLELAIEMQLPIFMHERDAHARFFDIIRNYRDQLVDGVVHCFTGSKEALFDYLDLDLHIGITGWVCDERRGQELQALVGNIPAQRLMIETDAPYLLPRTIKPRPKYNEPALLPHVLAGVAEHYPMDIQQLAMHSYDNSRRFFRL